MSNFRYCDPIVELFYTHVINTLMQWSDFES